MIDLKNLKHFNFWCQKVLPLVYDDSLSYYEVLCKVVNYINNILSEIELDEEQIKALQNDMAVVKKLIDDFNNFTSADVEKIIAEYFKVLVFFELTDSGYFVANIPTTWNDISFKTSGLDTTIAGVDYGHLCLYY